MTLDGAVRCLLGRTGLLYLAILLVGTCPDLLRNAITSPTIPRTSPRPVIVTPSTGDTPDGSG
jgi:hypothetical protein